MAQAFQKKSGELILIYNSISEIKVSLIISTDFYKLLYGRNW